MRMSQKILTNKDQQNWRSIGRKLAHSLAWPHHPDEFLRALHPALATQQVFAVITDAERQTNDSVTIRVRPNRAWQGFKAGQFAQLSVEIDGRWQTRCYSPANAANSDTKELEFTIRRHDRGLVSNHLFAQARSGMRLRLSQAAGDFHLPDLQSEHPESIVLISGGSGITPVLSMLRTLCAENFGGQIYFIHYARSEEQCLYRASLETLARNHKNLHLHLRYRAMQSAASESNRLTSEQMFSMAPDFKKSLGFVCGPDSLMHCVQSIWNEAGVGHQLFQERFTAATQPTDLSTQNTAIHRNADIRFAHSERLIQNNGDTLLEQAEAAGLNPQYGCRMGICHTCSCRKISGSVRDRLTGEFSNQPNEDIRLCVSEPLNTVTLDL